MKPSLFKTITDILFYSVTGLGVLLAAALIPLSVFPGHFQGKIILPVDLNITDPQAANPQSETMIDLGIENISSLQITYFTQDLFIVRILLVYYLIIVLSLMIALFFWKKIMKAYQKSIFFCKENRTDIKFLGWLLILYVPVFVMINLFFESLINLRVGRAYLDSSLSQGYHTGILLIVLGSFLLFLGQIRGKSSP